MNQKRAILYVDDDVDDIKFLRDAFQKIDSGITLHETHNGSEALAYLNGIKKGDLLPCLIILDINMPLLDGKQTLVRIKKIDAYKTIPIVMFSTSKTQMDIDFFKRWNVELIKKPITFANLEDIAHHFLEQCGSEAVRKI